MAQTITIHIWKEGEVFRSSVQEDTPGGYAFPEPFWSDYLEKKQVSRDLIAPFGEAIFRSAFNSLEREEMAHQILSGLKQAPLTFSIISSEDVIHEIPWELTKPLGGSFLGNMGNIAFARTLPGHKPVLRRSPQPYRVLVILSMPVETYEKAPLDPLRELENLYQALDGFVRKETVKIDVCLRASVPEIRGMLVRTQYDVVHFIGHGGPGGLLVLEDEHDFTRSHETSPEDIAYLFGDLGVQAVILNACHTQSAGFFRPSLAMFIYSVGVPLVVANQGSVDDTEAAGTARSLYEDLFQGESLPCLLNTARLKTGEWWKPVVFSPSGLKSKDLFLPAGEMTEALEGEKIFQDLGTPGTARVYVYRYRPLREISQHLAGDVKAIVLHGIGGAGKSFMADYLARFLRQEFSHVVALDLRRPGECTPEDIRTRILEIFESNEVISEKDAERLRSTRAFSLFWKRLNQTIYHVSWLLILDNFESLQDEWGLVTDPDMLEMLRVLRGPEWSGRLVITSRLIPYTESRRSLEPVVEIGTYDDAEKQFLYLQLNKKGQEKLKQHYDFVENELGWHPLATDLLLKASGPPPRTISEQRPLREVFSFYERYLERYPQAFARLFYMQHAFSPEFLDLLLKDADLQDLLARRLRLFRIHDGLVEPHPILRFIFAGNCSLSERDMLDLAEDLLPFEPKCLGDELNRLKVLERALRLGDLPEEKRPELKKQIAHAATRSGDYFRRYGKVDDAVGHYNRALELLKALYGEKHHDVATLYNNLGSAYRNKGDLDRAIAYLNKALELLKAPYGEKHPNVATLYNNLGSAYQDKGDLDRAIAYYNKALELFKALYGEKHPNVATSYNNLGMAYQNKGNLDRAIAYLNKALELLKALYGEKYPNVATSYNNLGIAYQNKGDLDRAIAYYNKALELFKALYVEKHPDVATSCNNLGSAYGDKGDLDRAISYHGDALRIWGGLPGYKKKELTLSIWIAGLQASTGRGTEAARNLCAGAGLLEFLGSDPDRGFWLSQASEILELAERLKTELEDDEFYNCRQIIRKYQEELGPVLERLRIMPASFLENDAPSEDIRL